MPRVWSNGSDVVVAFELGDLPRSLDTHYRVSGHTLRAGTWQEIPDAAVLRVTCDGNRTVSVVASELRRFADEGWVGKLVS
jgi:hypothetical protein